MSESLTYPELKRILDVASEGARNAVLHRCAVFVLDNAIGDGIIESVDTEQDIFIARWVEYGPDESKSMYDRARKKSVSAPSLIGICEALIEEGVLK